MNILDKEESYTTPQVKVVEISPRRVCVTPSGGWSDDEEEG